MTQYKNGELGIEQMSGSIRTIFDTKGPLKGLEAIAILLKRANPTEAGNLFNIASEYVFERESSPEAVDLYLKIYRQGPYLVRRCKWHPGYNDGKMAIIAGKKSLPVLVDEDYFKNVKGISDGGCSECCKAMTREERK